MQDFEAILGQLSALTGQAEQAIGSLQDADLQETPEVTAVGYRGRIKVSMKAGEVTAVELDDKAKRLDVAQLGVELAATFNEALRLNSEAMMAQAMGDQPDLAGLQEQLNALQVESVRAMDRINEGIEATLEQAKKL